MKNTNFLKKFLFLLLILFVISGCTVVTTEENKDEEATVEKTPTVNNPTEPTVPTPQENPDVILGKQIEAEYQALKAGTTTTHTVWTATGIVVDMSATKYNSSFKNYNVKLIVLVGETYIGIYNGFINGKYPENIDGLEVGAAVTFTGIIKEEYTLTSGNYTAQIEFSNPEISWTINEPATVPTNQYTNVNIAMINDTHGAFLDSNDGYSIARVDTLLDELEAKNGDYIKLANGDILQGSYVSSKNYGYQLIESLNEMDFDAFVIGNHEFDWGIDKIAAYKDGNLDNGEAEFPFLGANIVYKSNGERPEWIDAYTVVNYGDVKVGIIGLIGGDQESDILSTNVKDYDFIDEPTYLVEKYAKELRNDKDCDVVIVATHAHDKELNNKYAKLSDDARIDAILCAHTHQLITETVQRSDSYLIPVLQNYDKNETMRELILTLDSSLNIYDYSNKTYYPASFDLSADFDYLFEKYSDDINASNENIGYTNSQLSRAYIGSLVTEAMFYYDYNVSGFETIDLSLINTGGVRTTIDIGYITIADVFNTFPFENTVYLIEMYGSDINSLLNSLYSYSKKSVDVFEDNTIYKVAIIDFVYFNTYYSYIFNKKVSEYATGLLMRDIFIYHIKELY